jgi:hypothetical protein
MFQSSLPFCHACSFTSPSSPLLSHSSPPLSPLLSYSSPFSPPSAFFLLFISLLNYNKTKFGSGFVITPAKYYNRKTWHIPMMSVSSLLRITITIFPAAEKNSFTFCCHKWNNQKIHGHPRQPRIAVLPFRPIFKGFRTLASLSSLSRCHCSYSLPFTANDRDSSHCRSLAAKGL